MNDVSQGSLLDPFFNIKVIQATENPQRAAWIGMHQCYAEGVAIDDVSYHEENYYGAAIVKHLLAGDRGHFSPLEHNSLTVNVIGYPHTVMQQIRTHRVGVSFSVQSTRYTGQRVIDYVEGKRSFEEVFYLRQPDDYTGREGFYTYDNSDKLNDRQVIDILANQYAHAVHDCSIPHEHARYILPYATRQNWVFTCNARSLMHLLDLRHKPDAELETQAWAKSMFLIFKQWIPEVANWYETKRLNKGKLAP